MYEILLLIFLITIVEASAQVCIKKYRLNNKYNYILYAITLYFILIYLLYNCYSKNIDIGYVNLIWSCMSIIFVILFGVIFLTEKIKNKEMLAFMFAILAIFILYM